MGSLRLAAWSLAALFQAFLVSGAGDCEAQDYVKAPQGFLTDRQLFPSSSFFDDPRYKKVGFYNKHCTELAGDFLDTGSEFVLLLYAGSWTTKEGFWLPNVAHHLAKTLNLSTLAIDSRGRGASCGTEEVPGYIASVEDIQAAVDYVGSLGNRYAAGLMGHSSGGATAFMHAAQLGSIPAVWVVEPGPIKTISPWRWGIFLEQGVIQKPWQLRARDEAELWQPKGESDAWSCRWRLSREGFNELATVDLAAEAAKIPSDMHLYFRKADMEPLFEIDMLNATGAFSRLPAYRHMLFEDDFHHFLNHFDVFLTYMVDSLMAEMAQPHFYQNYIKKRATASQPSCTQGAQSRQLVAQALPEHHRLLAMDDLKTNRAEPNRLTWRTPFTTEGSQGLVNPASILDPSRGWITTVVPMATYNDDAPTQGGRTWQKVVVGFSGPPKSARPSVPQVKGAVTLDFESSSFARTIRRTQASREAGISFSSYRPFMMDGEPHVSYAMAIFDASLNLTSASPNNQKMRIQTTGIGRLNIKSKQLVSVIEFLEPLIPRREPLCCDKNWGLLELPTGQGEEHQLHIFYTMLPCFTVFGYNPSAPTGADFKSARCLSPAYSNLVQNKTGLDMHDVRISGHPVISRRRENGSPSELLFLAHHSWRQHGGAAHWAVLVDVETWQVTHISFKPVLHHEQFILYNEFVTNVISLGSYHLDGDVMRIFFGNGDKFASYADVDMHSVEYFVVDSSQSEVVAQNDVMLGERVNGGTTQKAYMSMAAWKRHRLFL